MFYPGQSSGCFNFFFHHRKFDHFLAATRVYRWVHFVVAVSLSLVVIDELFHRIPHNSFMYVHISESFLVGVVTRCLWTSNSFSMLRWNPNERVLSPDENKKNFTFVTWKTFKGVELCHENFYFDFNQSTMFPIPWQSINIPEASLTALPDMLAITMLQLKLRTELEWKSLIVCIRWFCSFMNCSNILRSSTSTFFIEQRKEFNTLTLFLPGIASESVSFKNVVVRRETFDVLEIREDFFFVTFIFSFIAIENSKHIWSDDKNTKTFQNGR